MGICVPSIPIGQTPHPPRMVQSEHLINATGGMLSFGQDLGTRPQLKSDLQCQYSSRFHGRLGWIVFFFSLHILDAEVGRESLELMINTSTLAPKAHLLWSPIHETQSPDKRVWVW